MILGLATLPDKFSENSNDIGFRWFKTLQILLDCGQSVSWKSCLLKVQLQTVTMHLTLWSVNSQHTCCHLFTHVVTTHRDSWLLRKYSYLLTYLHTPASVAV